jgi:hypothetical protein
MSSKHALRSRKTRAASRSALRVECLESRLALAVLGGNVTAQLLGSTLLLTGDALDNALVVSTATGGRMAVLGGLGTTINGSTSPFVTSRAVTSIVANLNAGNDVVGFTNSAVGLVNQLTTFGISSPFSPTDLQALIDEATGGIPAFTLPGSVTVTTAAGNDAVGIIGTVGGSVAANLGSSSSLTGPGEGNGFAIGDLFDRSVANRVGGSVSVMGGAQRDAVRISNTNVAGVMVAALGNGENFCRISGDGSTFGSFAYTGGTGDDGVFLNHRDPLTIRNGVSVLTGTQGRDFVELIVTTIGGSVVVNTGAGAGDDYIDVEADIRGGLSAITGAGNDSLNVYSPTIGGGLLMNSGAGDDTVGCGKTVVALNTVIDAGAGDDSVFINGLATRYNLFVYLGAGDDGLEVYNSSAFAAFLYGGTGTNSLETNAATRRGIRTLKYFQFQTVNNT